MGCFSKKASLVCHYGHADPGKNLKLYKTVVTELASKFKKRCEDNPKSERWVARPFPSLSPLLTARFLSTSPPSLCQLAPCLPAPSRYPSHSVSLLVAVTSLPPSPTPLPYSLSYSQDWWVYNQHVWLGGWSRLPSLATCC